MLNFLWKFRLQTVILTLLVVYVSSYYVWSRAAWNIAKRYNSAGYYFVLREPDYEPEWLEFLVQAFCFPCIQVDLFFNNPSPARAPLKDLV